MIIYDFDFCRTLCRPDEAHPELVVDPDGVLSIAIACQCLEPIARGRPQVAKCGRGMEIAQFPSSNSDQISRKTLRSVSVENRFGNLVPKGYDHRSNVSLGDTGVKKMYQIAIRYCLAT